MIENFDEIFSELYREENLQRARFDAEDMLYFFIEKRKMPFHHILTAEYIAWHYREISLGDITGVISCQLSHMRNSFMIDTKAGQKASRRHWLSRANFSKLPLHCASLNTTEAPELIEARMRREVKTAYNIFIELDETRV